MFRLIFPTLIDISYHTTQMPTILLYTDRVSHQVSPAHPTLQTTVSSPFLLLSLLHSYGPFSPGHSSSCLLISHLHFCSPNRYAGQLWLFKEAVQILPPQSPRCLLRSDPVHAPSLVQCMATFIHNDHSIVVISSRVSPGHWLQPVPAILPSQCSGSKSHQLLD